MSKVEEKALEKYPVKEYVSYGPLPGASGPSKFDDNKPYRIGFIEGYHQAEKDLELTWEDLKLMQDISHIVFAEVANGSVDYYQIYPTQQSFLEEVLKRYKNLKKGR